LLAYRAEIFAKPADYGPSNFLTGSFVTPPALRRALGEFELSAPLEAWLARGTPPVFLGFGSMPVLDVEAMLRTTRAALEQIAMRGVIGAGWSAVPLESDDLLCGVKNVDYESLLAKCSSHSCGYKSADKSWALWPAAAQDPYPPVRSLGEAPVTYSPFNTSGISCPFAPESPPGSPNPPTFGLSEH
jgi:hypothetical protein